MRLGYTLTLAPLPNEISRIRYLMYGTFSHLGKGLFLVTLHVTDGKNSRTESFSVKASLQTAARALVQKLFDGAQKEADRMWHLDEKERKKWIVPQQKGRGSFQEARLFCESQKARLPYARELMVALFGGTYHPGGVGLPQLKPITLCKIVVYG